MGKVQNKNKEKLCHYLFFFLIFTIFEKRSHHVDSGWPQTHDPPASVSQMLGLQANTTMMNYFFYLVYMLVIHINFYFKTFHSSTSVEKHGTKND
jgi:hypothetical protein